MVRRELTIKGSRWQGPDRRVQKRRRVFRKILLSILIVVLLGVVAVGSIALTARDRADSAYDRFSEAFASKDYPVALNIYRDVQERSLEEPIPFSYTDLYTGALHRMEVDLEAVVRDIVARMSPGIALDAPSVALFNGMQEVSGMLLTRFARETCEAYLGGDGQIAAIQSKLENLLTVEGAAAAMQAFLDDLPTMTAVQPLFIAADENLKAGKWIDAATGYLALVDGNAGFIRETAQVRLDACRSSMREPVLAEVETLLGGSRYYTALERLQLLSRIFPGDAMVDTLLEQCKEPTSSELELWTGPIEYIAIRPLIADTAQAFDGDSFAQAAADAMLTTLEFQRSLLQLYERGYILVDLPVLFDFSEKDGKVVVSRRALKLPKGKKPLVLGVEGLNYYAARHRTGNSISLSLDALGHVVSTYPSAGGMKTDANGEAIGILEQFLAQHADFSFNGARGTLSLTGYECVFGAVTDQDQLDDRNEALLAVGEAPTTLTDAMIETNRQEVLAVIQSLSSHGWSFASSTYGGIDAASASKARITEDTGKWTQQVEPLTGPTNILVYPNGSWLRNDDARTAILKGAGFRIFCGIGANAYLNIGKDSVFIDRVLLNGYSLQHTNLSRFLDAAVVLDSARPAE